LPFYKNNRLGTINFSGVIQLLSTGVTFTQQQERLLSETPQLQKTLNRRMFSKVTFLPPQKPAWF
ncbi:MAG: hypothetical protein VXW33_11115, partial [Pseudomonadota bacterium]|nr:hypothetical protein [Pseudomonadota bacterium]